MSKKSIGNLDYELTKENQEKIIKIIKKYQKEDGFLMPILQEVQDVFGFLPFKALEMISNELDISLEEIYGVVTFYTQFKLQEKGKYEISICLGTVCYVKGSEEILDEVKKELIISDGESTTDGLFSLDTTRCLGCCGLAPVMVINGKVYGPLTKKDVKGILDSYRGEK